MALAKCSECSEDVSTTAPACPHCGAPVGKMRQPSDMGDGFTVSVTQEQYSVFRVRFKPRWRLFPAVLWQGLCTLANVVLFPALFICGIVGLATKSGTVVLVLAVVIVVAIGCLLLMTLGAHVGRYEVLLKLSKHEIACEGHFDCALRWMSTSAKAGDMGAVGLEFRTGGTERKKVKAVRFNGLGCWTRGETVYVIMYLHGDGSYDSKEELLSFNSSLWAFADDDTWGQYRRFLEQLRSASDLAGISEFT